MVLLIQWITIKSFFDKSNQIKHKQKNIWIYHHLGLQINFFWKFLAKNVLILYTYTILILNNQSHATIPCSLRKVDAIHGKQRVLIFEWSPRLVMENAFFHYTVGENPNFICIDTITVSHILYKSKKSTLDLSNAGLM